MNRYFIEFSYKGTSYHGWQVQKNAVSVQSVMESAMAKIMREKISLTGAGRTDTGVHARMMFAHYDSLRDDLHNNTDFIFHLNCILPKDIAVKNISRVNKEAHARFDAISRTYEYHIVREKDPFSTGLAWELRGDLDINRMNDAAEILFDYQDFSCFSKSNTQVKTNLCTITRAEWKEFDRRVVFTITANRFLRNMVRAITGTSVEIGQHKQPVEWMRKVIEGRNRSDAGQSVPAQGLYLTEVRYPREVFRF